MSGVDRKKLLNEPDEFITFSDKAVKWAGQNKRLLMIIVGVLIVVIGAVAGVQGYVDYHARQAGEALAPAFSLYYQAMDGEPEKAKLEAADQALARVTAQYGATASGMQARMARGNVLIELSEWAKAEAVFRELTEEPEIPEDFLPLVWRGLGQSLEGEKKYTDAASAYATAAKLAGESQRVMFELDQARALSAGGEKDAAVKLYKDIMEKKPDPGSLDIAKAGLTSLGVDPQPFE